MLSSASKINAMRRIPSLANRPLCLDVMGGDCARNRLAVTIIRGFRPDNEIAARVALVSGIIVRLNIDFANPRRQTTASCKEMAWIELYPELELEESTKMPVFNNS